jgi:hypothetical protein
VQDQSENSGSADEFSNDKAKGIVTQYVESDG